MDAVPVSDDVKPSTSKAEGGLNDVQLEVMPEPSFEKVYEDFIQLVQEKLQESDEKIKKRKSILDEVIEKIQGVDSKFKDSEMKDMLFVEIEEMERVKDLEKGRRMVYSLKEDLDHLYLEKKAKHDRREEDRQKLQEFRAKKEKIPRELQAKYVQKNRDKLKKLEKMKMLIVKKIDKLRKQEVTFEELDSDDSPYLSEDRFLKKLKKVQKEIDQLKGYTIEIPRPLHKKFSLKPSSGYPDIDVCVGHKTTQYLRAQTGPSGSKTTADSTSPDIEDVCHWILSTDSGKGMSDDSVRELAVVILKSIVADVRKRLHEELFESWDIIENDEDFGQIDVHDTDDPELIKKLEEAESKRVDLTQAGLKLKNDIAEEQLKTGEESTGTEGDEDEEDEEEEEEDVDDAELKNSDDDEEGDDDNDDGEDGDASTPQAPDGTNSNERHDQNSQENSQGTSPAHLNSQSTEASDEPPLKRLKVDRDIHPDNDCVVLSSDED